MSEKLKWGILGAGAIAKAFVKGVQHGSGGVVVAVGSRDKARADQFADELGVATRHGSYEALLADTQVQAVYIATPHPMHAIWAIRAAEAKKHLLVEKPIGVNHAEAMAIVEAVIANDVFLMEAYMYRCHPQTAKLVELIKSKAIGDVRMIQANLGYHAGFNADGRQFNNDLAGGGILDMGGYCTSIAGLIAGAANGKDFEVPLEIKASGILNAVTKVDEYAAAVLKYPGDIIAQLATGVACTMDNVVRILGTEGNIYLARPIISSREGDTVTTIVVNKKGEERPREIVIEAGWLFSMEADTVAANLQQRQSPAMTWNQTLANMRVLDTWRQQIGLTYDMEKQERLPTIDHRPLAVSPTNNMKYGQIAGVKKPVSRLIMGIDSVVTAPHLTMMWDDYFRRGGNTWDTGYIYGGGICEKLLGAWIKHRGLREQVVILNKGAHTPFCTPFDIDRQFKESLERLQTDYADIYMMHRDNAEIPVGEFADVLHEHVKAGRMRAIGGSNWSTPRIEAFNAYAKKNGRTPFTAFSNQFSLARMIEPMWDGCVASSSLEWRKWLTAAQLPILAWSSQSRGFFVPGIASPERRDDKEMVRCWYSEDNFGGQARVFELAKKRGVEPVNIALAYVLNQPFPTYALIGPKQLSETRSCMKGLDIKLSPEELRWLNLET